MANSEQSQGGVGDLFQRACLIQLATSCWLGTRNLPPAILNKIGKGEWIRGKKLLINPEYLGPIHTTIHRARTFLKQYALPFPLTGLTLVPKDSLQVVDAGLKAFEAEYWERVQAFVKSYESAREEAKAILGELFHEADYPIHIEDKFKFQWRFLVLDIPHKSSVLTPEIYQREMRKFQELMEETRELAMVALREEFGQVLQALTDKLTGGSDGKPKVIRSSMLNKLNEFLESFQNRNLFEDDKLAELIEQARSVMNQVSPYALKYNEVLRQKVSAEMQRLSNEVEKAIEELPRRRIRMAA